MRSACFIRCNSCVCSSYFIFLINWTSLLKIHIFCGLNGTCVLMGQNLSFPNFSLLFLPPVHMRNNCQYSCFSLKSGLLEISFSSLVNSPLLISAYCKISTKGIKTKGIWTKGIKIFAIVKCRWTLFQLLMESLSQMKASEPGLYYLHSYQHSDTLNSDQNHSSACFQNCSSFLACIFKAFQTRLTN